MKEITLTKEQYENLPYRTTKLTKDDTFGAMIGLLRKRGIRKYFMDDETETISFEYRVKLKDMEKRFLVKMQVPHLLYMAKVNPLSRSKHPEVKLTYLEDESWRILYWYLKNKLDAIQFGIVDDLKEFIPNIYYELEGREVNLADTIIANADRIASLKAITDESTDKPRIVEATFEVKE